MITPEAAMEEKSDGLEIVSVGKLYSGPWEKKYWSSSRGKDRYPYPIGYKGLRNQNGVTYELEILEGLKGPLFLITAADGQSNSGRTPDIAWECFQKKGCPRIKSLPGKRFSCKIDGVEFFGFKNASVQRLLRELVADVSETAEKLQPASNYPSRVALETNHPSQCIKTDVDPDLPLHMKKTEITGKRSRTEKIKTINSNSSTGLKKDRHRKKQCTADASHSIGRIHESIKSPKVLPGSVRLECVVQKEQNQGLEEDSSQLASMITNDHHNEHYFLPQDENKCSSNETQPSLEEVRALHKDGKPFDRSDVFKGEVHANPSIKQTIEEMLDTNDLHLINDAKLNALNTLDHLIDDSSNRASTNRDDDITAHDTTLSDVLRTNSHIEEEIGIPCSNSSSVKTECKRYHQEVAKPMRTDLPPGALPSFKTFSRKKKNAEPTGKSPYMFQEETKSDLDSITSVSKLSENLNLEMKKEDIKFAQRDQVAVLPCGGHVDSIVPDSLDDYEDVYVPDTELPESCEIVKNDESSPDLDTRLCGTPKLPDVVDSEEGSRDCNDFQIDLCDNAHDLRISDTSMACKTTLETVSNTIDGCGVVAIEVLTIVEPMRENVPLSESIICREFRDDSDGEACAKVSPSSAVRPSKWHDHVRSQVERELSGNEQKVGRSPLFAHVEDRATSVDGVLHDVTTLLQREENNRILDGDYNSDAHPTNSRQDDQNLDEVGEHTDDQNYVSSSLSYMQNYRMDTYGCLSGKKIESDDSNITSTGINDTNNKLKGSLKLVSCYVHPVPVSMVLVAATEEVIHICVLCGPYLQKERKLFIYKAPLMGEDEGHPSFVGYASLGLPFGRDIELDSSAMQFSPDGHFLLLLNSIKVPCCREGNVYCPCSACGSDLQDNAVKIMQIKAGYASVIARLQSTGRICCILVCRPHHLIAADDSGKLYIWTMNSTWSEKTEECFVQSPSCMTHLTGLKRIPNLLHLVLGINGLGEFSVWDINKRVLVSKFSSPHTSVFQCVPLSLFTWKVGCNILQDLCIGEVFDKIVDSTKASLSVKGGNEVVSYVEGDEVVVWLLVSTAPDCDELGYQYQISEQSDPLRCWRLALLANNTVIMGDMLEPRTAAVGASVGSGIIGTSDGHVYMWDFVTGTKIGSLHHFKDGSVSSIATDDSHMGALAIANDGGQLIVYLPT
ncbi:unnamed protein product [Cuscuta europaea]|uniref:FYR C-terminal domain-containing protein n=1 Tax=Cuscuta europaea TaxID=41803 RepID=A0A9P0ZWJ2_CUSEU|nr:unnamed protein product [Cuscuta europaea]